MNAELSPVSAVLELARGFTTVLWNAGSARAVKALTGEAELLCVAIERLSDNEVVELDKRIRSYCSGLYWQFYPADSPPKNKGKYWFKDLIGHKNYNLSQACVCIAATSPDGYTRQFAIKSLHPNKAAEFVLLALRATDWVPQVREAAIERLSTASADQVVGHLPLLESLTKTRSRSGELEKFYQRLLSTPEGATALDIGRESADYRVRRICWRRLGESKAELSKEEIRSALEDRDLGIRLWAVGHFGALSAESQCSLATQLAKDPAGRIRALGVELLLREQSDSLELVNRFIVDRSLAVRRVVQSFVLKSGGDPVQLYRQQLKQRVTASAIFGLAEAGGAAVTDEVEGFALSSEPFQRRAATLAIEKCDSQRSFELAVRMLDDQSQTVVVAALRVLGRRAVPAEVAFKLQQLALSDDRAKVRVTALMSIRRLRWCSLATTVQLLDDANDEVRLQAESELLVWLKYATRLNRKPSVEDASQIESNIERVKDSGHRQQIKFVLRTAGGGS